MKITKGSRLALLLLVLPGVAQAATWYRATTPTDDNLWLNNNNWINPATPPDGVGASVLIDRDQLAVSANTILDLGGNTVTVGQIDIVAGINFIVDINNGTIMFDNGGSAATWDIENDGNPFNHVTTKGSAGYVLSDDLVITNRSLQTFRPGGPLADASGESHSVTYVGGLGLGLRGFKLGWTASNTGGTIVDAGAIRFNALNGDTYIGQAASGADIVLKNGGTIWNEESSHQLSRTIEIGTGGGTLISEAGRFLTLSGVISGAGELTLRTRFFRVVEP